MGRRAHTWVRICVSLRVWWCGWFGRIVVRFATFHANRSCWSAFVCRCRVCRVWKRFGSDSSEIRQRFGVVFVSSGLLPTPSLLSLPAAVAGVVDAVISVVGRESVSKTPNMANRANPCQTCQRRLRTQLRRRRRRRCRRRKIADIPVLLSSAACRCQARALPLLNFVAPATAATSIATATAAHNQTKQSPENMPNHAQTANTHAETCKNVSGGGGGSGSGCLAGLAYISPDLFSGLTWFAVCLEWLTVFMLFLSCFGCLA